MSSVGLRPTHAQPTTEPRPHWATQGRASLGLRPKTQNPGNLTAPHHYLRSGCAQTGATENPTPTAEPILKQVRSSSWQRVSNVSRADEERRWGVGWDWMIRAKCPDWNMTRRGASSGAASLELQRNTATSVFIFPPRPSCCVPRVADLRLEPIHVAARVPRVCERHKVDPPAARGLFFPEVVSREESGR